MAQFIFFIKMIKIEDSWARVNTEVTVSLNYDVMNQWLTWTLFVAVLISCLLFHFKIVLFIYIYNFLKSLLLIR